jgi:hypothetical protein
MMCWGIQTPVCLSPTVACTVCMRLPSMRCRSWVSLLCLSRCVQDGVAMQVGSNTRSADCPVESAHSHSAHNNDALQLNFWAEVWTKTIRLPSSCSVKVTSCQHKRVHNPHIVHYSDRLLICQGYVVQFCRQNQGLSLRLQELQ